MIEFGGIVYYVDIAAFDKAVEPSGQKVTDLITATDVKTIKNADGVITSIEEFKSIRVRGKELDPARFDLIKTMLEVVLSGEDEVDASLGAERGFEAASLSFKIAFNTLYNYGIIKEKQ